MPSFGEGKFIRVYTAAKENLTSVHKLFLRFWQTKLVKGKLSREICQGKLVDRTQEKVNLSTKTC